MAKSLRSIVNEHQRGLTLRPRAARGRHSSAPQSRNLVRARQQFATRKIASGETTAAVLAVTHTRTLSYAFAPCPKFFSLAQIQMDTSGPFGYVAVTVHASTVVVPPPLGLPQRRLTESYRLANGSSLFLSARLVPAGGRLPAAEVSCREVVAPPARGRRRREGFQAISVATSQVSAGTSPTGDVLA